LIGSACALTALEPIASMKRPMIADAARPPTRLTTLFFALLWRTMFPLEALYKALLLIQRGIARLASPAFRLGLTALNR
jgi:hypothetical protein